MNSASKRSWFTKLLGRSNSGKSYQRMEEEADVPPLLARRGCFAMYVGEEAKIRYEVPIRYLSLPSFKALLNQSEEDVYLDSKIVRHITVSCNIENFDQLLKNAKDELEAENLIS